MAATELSQINNAINFQSHLLSFSITMQSSDILGNELRLPSYLSARYTIEKKGTVGLQVPNGKSWEINYFDEGFMGYSRIVLLKGWKDFAQDNCLEVGDVCAFELLPDKDTFSLQVSISRASDGPGHPLSGNRESSHQSGCGNQTFEKPSGSTSSSLGDLTPKTPRFFQIILDDGEAEREKKLWIPRRFVRNYGHDLSKYAQVTDPRGRKWKLECSKCDTDTWFRNGWQDFADFYSLAHGHLLVFEYRGNSQFSVAIFDETATEIEYPVKSLHDIGQNLHGNVRDVKTIKVEKTGIDELVTEISNEFTPSSKELKKSHQLPTDQKKLSFSAEEYKVLSIDEKCKHRVFGERTKQLNENEKAKALDSPYPFFSLTMRPSHLIPSSVRLYIPFSFAVDYIEAQGNAILYLDGRRWDIEYFSDRSSSRAALGNGWKVFALENDLKVGDVCVFELINEINVTFKVHIYRVDENTNPCPSGGKLKQVTHQKVVNRKSKKTHIQLKEHRIIESADKFSSKNLFFGVIMQSNCLNSPYLNIPIDFVEKHLGQDKKDILLKVGNKSWTVQFCAPGRFCGGWYTFVKANSLQDKDVCIFEQIKKTNLMLEVHIFRGNHF